MGRLAGRSPGPRDSGTRLRPRKRRPYSMGEEITTVEDLQRRAEDIEDAVEAAEDTVEEAQTHIEGAKANLAALKEDIEDLPNGQKTGNVEDELTVGEQYGDVVIVDDGNGTEKGDPMVRIDGIVTFLTNVDQPDVREGDTVDVVISQTQDTFARGVVRMDEGDTDA